ncbi:hypothetical protein ABPG74_004107 [Tetrahymena malaccensis]
MDSLYEKDEEFDEQDAFQQLHYQQSQLEHTLILNKQQLFRGSTEKDILNLISKFPSSEEYIQNLKKKYNLLRDYRDREAMSRTNSSNSYQSGLIMCNAKVLEQSESDEDQIQKSEIKYCEEDQQDDDDEDEIESLQEQEERNYSNSESPIKYSKKLSQHDSIKEYDDGSYNLSSREEDSLIRKEQIGEFKKLEPIEKLATFKKYKQTFLKQPTESVREFFCEILHDKIEEEKIVKMKYIAKVIGYIFIEKSFNLKYLAKLIEEKELRQKIVREVLKGIYDEEKVDRNQISPFVSAYKVQKFVDDLQSLLSIKDEDKKIQKEDEILKELISRKQEISNYESNEEFKNLIEQIIIFKAQRYFDFSNSAKLIASFLLKLNMSSSFMFKYLLDSQKLQKMCSYAMEIIRFLSNNQKYDAPQQQK